LSIICWKGFLVSKFYTNVAVIGNTVFVREVVDGIPSLRKDDWSPTLYVKGNPKDSNQRVFKTLYGDNAYAMQPGSVRDTKDFVDQYKGVSGFEIFGQLNYTLQYCNEYKSHGWQYNTLSSWSIDVETTIPTDENGKTYFPEPTSADGEILLITLVNMHTGEAYTFGSRPYSGEGTHYTKCADEKQLLKLFLDFWEQRRVEIITGWNIKQFDLPYIHNRIVRILGADVVKRLSPWGRVNYREKLFMGNKEYVTDILGVSVLDYMDLYKKYIFVKQESYSLGHIAQEELGTTKVDHSEYGSFTDFYTKNIEKFTWYNIVDTQLIKQLDDKLKLIELVLTIAYEAGINYEDTSSPVKTWDAIISNYCLEQGVVLPQQKHEPHASLDGAYVKEPVPGWYKNVVSLDATSLYPSIIMTNNISPETYLYTIDMDVDTFLQKPKHGIDENKIVTPIGAVYDRTKRGVLPVLVERFMKMRREAKNEMLRLEQEIELIEAELKSRA
jgi:DNA polymerase elongation subunit (family B)